jgi:hypothetical protein
LADEDILLLIGDRVFVTSSRPSRVVLTVDVNVPKFDLWTRAITSPEDVALKERRSLHLRGA